MQSDSVESLLAAMNHNWPFDDPKNVATFTVRQIVRDGNPILRVARDAEDGAWQFLGDSMSNGGGPVISCFHHPIDRDPSLAELADMPLGWYAERHGVGEPWTRKKHTDDRSE